MPLRTIRRTPPLPRAALPVLLATALATALGLPSAAPAARSEQQAAPAYPDTRLSIAVTGRPRAGSIATVVLKGWVERRPLTEEVATSYSVELFVQNRRVLKRCPASYGAQLNNVIDLSGEIAHIGRNLNAGDGGRFRVPVRYRTGTTRDLVYCAYVRFVVDDAAVAGLRHRLAPARRAGSRRGR